MSEWISVENTLPQNDDEVLVCNEGLVYYCHYRNGNFIFESYSSYGDCDDELYTKVTHWQPLPQPPQGK